MLRLLGDVLMRRLNRAFFLLASCALAGAAHASYGQMRLDGIGFLLVFMLTVAYGLIVDAALFARLFRHRAALVGGLIVALAVIVLLLGTAASPSERAGFFNGAPGGASLVVLVMTSAVFLPFIILAPLAQYRSMRQQGRRWPAWVTVWMALQVALLPGFFVLASTEEHFRKLEYAAGYAVGREARTGELGGMLELADQRRERIWGTGWAYPWRQEPPVADFPRHSGWIAGLAMAVDGSALIAANDPLSAADRTAMQTLIERHLVGYAISNIHTKLIWDALEPGDFSRQLAPRGLNEQGVVNEELIPLLLERLEKHGAARLCPGGRMMGADRDLLNQLVLAKVRDYDGARKRELEAELEAKKLEHEMSEAPAPYRLIWQAAHALGNTYGEDVRAPDWSSYPQRVERLCRGPD